MTVADLTNLVTDSETIAGAGLRLDSQSLETVAKELVTAIANGTSTTQAQSDFNALFSGSNVAQTSIDKTFNDLVQTIQDSKITAADLTTLAADQAAIQTDRTNLHDGSGTSVTSSTNTAGSGTSGGSGSSGSSGSSTTTTSSSSNTTTHFARLRSFRGFSRLRRRVAYAKLPASAVPGNQSRAGTQPLHDSRRIAFAAASHGFRDAMRLHAHPRQTRATPGVA